MRPFNGDRYGGRFVSLQINENMIDKKIPALYYGVNE